MTYANNQRMMDILTTAIEGGCAYWMNEEDDCRNVGVMRDSDLNVTQMDCETNIDGKGWVKHTITATEIRKALNEAPTMPGKFINDYVIKRCKVMLDGDGDYDAGDADTAVQLALFKDIVYG